MNNIFDIEKKYNVKSIKYNGICIWPIIRVYIAAKIVFNKERITINKKNILSLILSFTRGFKNLIFTKAKYLAFSDTDRRVFINGKYFDRLVDPIADELKILIIETPLYNHYPSTKTFSNELASSLPFKLLVEIISWFTKVKKIESEDTLVSILGELEFSINYKKLIKRTFAEELIMKNYFKLKKIKGVFVVVSYTKPGIIFACKKLGIPVIELQHGVINDYHYAYNIKDYYGNVFYPDYLYTYSENEKKVFLKDNYFIKSDNVIPIGNYLIDIYRKENLYLTELEEKTKGFDLLVAISGQISFDYLLVPFLLKLANLNKNIAFIFIPRADNYFIKNTIPIPPNIFFINSLNTYEIIRRVNIHASIASTCSLEALALGIPNIFINLNDLSIKFFKYLEKYKYNYFIQNIKEFNQIIKDFKRVEKNKVINEYNFLFNNNYKQSLSKALKLLNVL